MNGLQRSLAGLATLVCDELGNNCVDDGSGSGGGSTPYTYTGGCPVGMLQTQNGCYDPGYAPGSGPSSSPASGSGFNWSSWVAGLANQWTQIGGRVIAPQTTYTRNPDGSISYSTPGSGALPAGLGASSSSSLIWIGGALILGLVVLSAVKK